MPTSNALQQPRANDLEWYLLGEYSPGLFLSGHDNGGDLTAALLSQTMGEWGIPLEILEIIGPTLAGFAKETLVHFNQGGLELPGRIRVFCNRKMLDEANLVKTTSPVHAEQSMERAPIKHHSCTIMKWGWGYFIIERPGDGASSSEKTHPFVDLYLYKEGE